MAVSSTGFPAATSPVSRLRYRLADLRYGQVFDTVARHARGDVLDVGGGDFVVRATARGASYDRWLVVEPDAQLLPSVADERVATMVGDGRALDLADASFDTTLSIQVLEHTFEPFAMLGELVRVTRPGGAIIVMVPQTANIHHAPMHFQNFTRYWLDEAARRLELEVVEYHPLGGAWSTLASRVLLQYPAAFGVRGYRHPGARRGWRFWALLPVGLVISAVTFAASMLMSLGDMEEEANNHLVVLRRPAT